MWYLLCTLSNCTTLQTTSGFVPDENMSREKLLMYFRRAQT